MEKINVEVAYAKPDQQFLKALSLPVGSTVKDAIKASAVCDVFPEIDLETMRVGVFSIFVGLNDELKSGDRVEIYRPLIIDPKEARRLRARNRA